MQIKKRDLRSIYDNLDELRGFISGYLDFADDDQVEYINEILDRTDSSLEILNKFVD